jgi:hypothetical protein
MNVRTIKSVLNVLYIHSILLLTILSTLGWTWHRVLPEHLHVFFGIYSPQTTMRYCPLRLRGMSRFSARIARVPKLNPARCIFRVRSVFK